MQKKQSDIIEIDPKIWTTPAQLAKELGFTGKNKTQRITNWIKRNKVCYWKIEVLNIVLVDRTSVPDMDN